ncbi:uncharacterized protein LOC130689888 [Daphnia carinata]|uniref:uncharacterized protein LOC130689888 n=1 Tax=Daphnia carinata TaxID=120202 RepID=UPI002868EB5F|nr:uncharacterized protein LOC130689888 [Daphnia carinata]
MDVDKEVQRLERLMKDSEANMSEIIEIYFNIAKEGTSTVSSAMPFLKDSAVHLLSSELMKILKKHRLDAFSYILVANNLLDVGDIKDELENGDALTSRVPPNAIRKLKTELGVASVLSSATPTAERAPLTPLEKPQVSMSSTNYLASKHIALKITYQKNVNGMTVYKLPLERSLTFSGASSIIRRFSFGEPDPFGSRGCKTILLMGATGSGKTTMINAMINYVLGIQWEDPFRFILIDENETSQAFSQTRKVTAYDIHYRNGFRIPYSLTIVDTPGFGDTEGIERDKQITSAIKQFFEHENGIQELNAVGFVAQSALARLTSSQTYIFNSVLSIFGKDIGENVRILVTFADGSQPSVLAAIKEAKLPCQMDSNNKPCHQKFNNGVVYASNQIPDDDMSPIEWRKAMQNFQSFFAELSNMPIKSLQLTKEVLNCRESLQIAIKGLETTIQAHLMKIEELWKTEKIITLNKDHVNANKDFKITVKVPKKKKVEVGMHLTALNCSKCEVTCHYPCNRILWTGFCPAFWHSDQFSPTMPDSANNVSPSISHTDQQTVIQSVTNFIWSSTYNTAVNTATSLGMRGRRCKVCPGKCATDVHSNEPTRWEYVQEDETRTLCDIRKKYDEAMKKTLNVEELKKALQGEAEQLKFDIIKAMDQIIHYKNHLTKIALRGEPLSTPEYIKLMIENEEKEKKPGHSERIRSFKDLLIKVRLTRNVTDGGDLGT